ncbi:MAG TPA: tRNA (adenosine(37)-N6)-threonylcarbamoyltransferase complex dimerization subunit type 1 TsaB [Verrucomicrobiae bacterium]|jgi:tRNA threonylcarbamoyl adenosine modification protein YeaZ|nr:tRNA (adenosine(37)-N6)-threonylcarbamoyltransferase complex dimerization subunit type 1 TsaB [Verrucomicrobiae bacterium]
MKILAIECSSSQRSVAALDEAGALLGAAREWEGRNAIALVERALASAKLEREDIGVVAVGLGPGSYTGIRGAVALAQGWQLGRAAQLLGISSVDALAAQAQHENLRGPVNIIIDAQRQEFYLARFEITAEERRVVEPLRLASRSDLEKVAGDGIMAGPGAAAWFPRALNLYPDAATLGRLAAARSDFIPGEKLAPIYLRAVEFKKGPVPRIVP